MSVGLDALWAVLAAIAGPMEIYGELWRYMESNGEIRRVVKGSGESIGCIFSVHAFEGTPSGSRWTL